MVANSWDSDIMNIEIVFGLIALIVVLVVLLRVISEDGYGVRPGPGSHREEKATWAMPHDAIRSGRR